MYYNKCCVPGCSSTRQDVKLHKFPNSEKGRNKWLKKLKCDKLRGWFECFGIVQAMCLSPALQGKVLNREIAC